MSTKKITRLDTFKLSSSHQQFDPESMTFPAALDRADELDLADIRTRPAVIVVRLHLHRVPDVDGEDGPPVGEDFVALLGLERPQTLVSGL